MKKILWVPALLVLGLAMASCDFIEDLLGLDTLDAPMNPIPADQAAGVALDSAGKVALSWDAPDFNSEIVSYDVYFGETLPNDPSSRDRTTTTWTTDVLSPGVTYKWYVVATASGQSDATSSTWSFTTAGSGNAAPTKPSIPVPEPNATRVFTMHTFRWTASTDPDGDPVAYNVYLGEGTLPEQPTVAGVVNAEWKPGDPLKANTVYKWKVVALDDKDGKTESDTWSFTTIEKSVSVLYPVNPSDPEPETNLFKTLLEMYRADRPDTEIVYTLLPDDVYGMELYTRILAGDIPDVFALGNAGTINMTLDLAEDLTTRLAAETNNFIPQAQAQLTTGTKLFALPDRVLASHVVFANDALMSAIATALSEPFDYPATLADLLAQKAQIDTYNASNPDVVPIAMANGNQYEGWQIQSCLLSTLAQRHGGQTWYTDALSVRNAATFGDASFVAALQDVSDLWTSGMFPQELNTWSYIQAMEKFAAGEAVYMINGSWAASWLAQYAPAVAANVSMHAFPDVTGQVAGTAGSASTTTSGLAMNGALGADQANAAWDFIWFWCGPEGSTMRADQFNGTPAWMVNRAAMSLQVLQAQTLDYVQQQQYTWIMDAVVPAACAESLQPNLKLMTDANLATPTPAQVAAALASWIATNEPPKTWP